MDGGTGAQHSVCRREGARCRQLTPACSGLGWLRWRSNRPDRRNIGRQSLCAGSCRSRGALSAQEGVGTGGARLDSVAGGARGEAGHSRLSIRWSGRHPCRYQPQHGLLIKAHDLAGIFDSSAVGGSAAGGRRRKLKSGQHPRRRRRSSPAPSSPHRAASAARHAPALWKLRGPLLATRLWGSVGSYAVSNRARSRPETANTSRSQRAMQLCPPWRAGFAKSPPPPAHRQWVAEQLGLPSLPPQQGSRVGCNGDRPLCIKFP